MPIKVIHITDPLARSEVVAVDFERADALNRSIRTICIRHRARWAAKLEPLGIHPAHEIVLLQLDAQGPQTQKQLAAGGGCEPPTITLMVSKLEAMGLLSRRTSDQDARSVVVTLTSKGKRTIPRLKSLWQELADETVDYLPSGEVDGLIDALTDLAHRLQNHEFSRQSARYS
jgi:DNA-binding MarR family transcriptional regulator